MAIDNTSTAQASCPLFHFLDNVFLEVDLYFFFKFY